MSTAFDNAKKRWAECKLAFSDISKEDAQDILKVMVIQSIDGDWGAGFINLAKLELLTKAFPEDGLLIEMYRQLLERCNQFVTDMTPESAIYIAETCFRDQPTTYKHGGDGIFTWYDVNDDPILHKLLVKYHKISNIIKDVVYS